MADIITFEWDIPVEVSLRFPQAKVYASKYPGGDDRHMYSTTDGRVMYLDPLTAARVNSLGVVPGEFFYITKHKRGRLTEYSVCRELSQVPPAPPVVEVTSPGYANARTSGFGGHPKVYPPQKSNLPERLYYKPGSEEDSLEAQLAASIASVEQRRVGEQGDATFAVGAPAPRKDAVRETQVQTRPVVAAQKPAVPPVKVPMDRAVVDAVRMVQNAMKETGEQWSDQARQDLVSTILIAAQKEGWVGFWRKADAEEGRNAA